MTLAELEGKFVKIVDERTTYFGDDVTIENADGIDLLCPVCFVKNQGPAGTHSIRCWRPRVAADRSPGPGRWEFKGTSIADLTLFAAASSIQLTGPGCGAHFYIRQGQIEMS